MRWSRLTEEKGAPLRQFTLTNSDHPNHTVQTRALHAYLRWRNAYARHPDVLAAQRCERARVRSEKAIRWGATPRILSLKGCSPNPVIVSGHRAAGPADAGRSSTGWPVARPPQTRLRALIMEISRAGCRPARTT
ncbi:hypothetical protein GCM10010412_099880 [Nonomuraea recticatena]|uniref:Integrase n=1 Tax=Nonomuraea recticatena TaxID=46178 RepID=A0ABP6FVW9_9ACTN